MKATLDCIPCFLKQSIEAARMATDDERKQEEVIKQVLSLLRDISFNQTPPEISRDVHSIIRKTLRSSDPYLDVKIKGNEFASKKYKKLKQIIEESNDPLNTAIKLAIIGNVIDFGTEKRFSLDEAIKKYIDKSLDSKTYSLFKNRLENANKILYLADNTGEIYFDKLLLEELNKLGKSMYYVVKKNPIINDATKEDAESAGINKIAMIIEGDKDSETSCPGMVVSNASDEFLELFNNAEMIISKGQGNFEALNSQKREIFFLLMVKCPFVANEIKEPLGNPVFKVHQKS